MGGRGQAQGAHVAQVGAAGAMPRASKSAGPGSQGREGGRGEGSHWLAEGLAVEARLAGLVGSAAAGFFLNCTMM